MLPTPDAMDPRRLARQLFFQGWSVTAIAEKLTAPRSTVEAWKQRDAWADTAPIDRVDQAIEARMCQLVFKDEKSGSDYKEIDLLGRQLERIARVRRYEAPGGHEGDLNPNIAARNAKPKKKPVSNEYSPEQATLMREAYHEEMFAYQRVARGRARPPHSKHPQVATDRRHLRFLERGPARRDRHRP